MAGEETILQNLVVADYLLPFLLMFFILFAILEKTEIFGKDKKQSNALVSFIVSLIFVTAVTPKLFVGNFVLFLTVAIVVLFVGLLMWGFVYGEAKIKGNFVTAATAVVITVAVLVALLIITGVYEGMFNFLFDQSWSKTFWTNASFLIIIAGALAFALKKGK
mgnify:CR=1 FL=1